MEDDTVEQVAPAGITTSQALQQVSTHWDLATGKKYGPITVDSTIRVPSNAVDVSEINVMGPIDLAEWITNTATRLHTNTERRDQRRITMDTALLSAEDSSCHLKGPAKVIAAFQALFLAHVQQLEDKDDAL